MSFNCESTPFFECLVSIHKQNYYLTRKNRSWSQATGMKQMSWLPSIKFCLFLFSPSYLLACLIRIIKSENMEGLWSCLNMFWWVFNVVWIIKCEIRTTREKQWNGFVHRFEKTRFLFLTYLIINQDVSLNRISFCSSQIHKAVKAKLNETLSFPSFLCKVN